MWAAPGSYRATYQPAAPDADHSPAFWRSLARDVQRRPQRDPGALGRDDRRRRLLPARRAAAARCSAQAARRYRVAGMQQAVDVMRRAGYRGVIAIPGVDYANDLSRWLAHRPRDSRRQLVAEAHVYGKNACSDNDVPGAHAASGGPPRAAHPGRDGRDATTARAAGRRTSRA